MSDTDEFENRSDSDSELGTEANTTLDTLDEENQHIFLSDLIKDNRIQDAIQALEDGADANEKDREGRPPIYTAIATGSRDVVKALLSHGASLSNKAPFLSTVVDRTKAFYSLVTDRPDAMSELTALRTPAMHAVDGLAELSTNGDAEEMALLLLTRDPRRDAIELGNSRSPGELFYIFWIWAVARGYSQVVKIMVEERNAPRSLLTVKTELFDIYLETPFHILERCASEGELTLISYLLDHSSRQSTPIYTEAELSTALAECAKNYKECKEKLIMLKRLIEAGASPRGRCREGKTALAWTCERSGDHDLVVFLLSAGADKDVNARDGNGQIPLHPAAWHNPRFHKTMQVLLENGADINAVDDRGRTPLWYAVSLAASATNVAFLLERGAEVDLRGTDENGSLCSTPLMESCLRCTGEDGMAAVATLLAYGANVNASTARSTPLLCAFERDYSERYDDREDLCWILLDAGAKSVLDGFPRQPLVEVVDCTRDEGDWFFEVFEAACRQTEGRIPQTVLHAAIDKAIQDFSRVRLDIVVALVRAGGNPRQRTKYHVLDRLGSNPEAVGHNVMHCIAMNDVAFDDNVTLAIEYLLARGADLSEIDDEGQTPLHLATKKPKKAIVEVFLDNGAMVDAVDGDGATPLSLACQFPRNSQEVDRYTSWLVDRRDRRYASTRGQNTASCIQFGRWQMVVEAEGHEEVIHMLRERGANLLAKDHEGMTLLHHACRVGNHNSVAVLLQYRMLFQTTSDVPVEALIRAEDGEGKTVLHWAASCGNAEVVRMVLSANSSRETDFAGNEGPRTHHAAYDPSYIQWQDHAGNSALYYAVEKGSLDVVKVLLEDVKVHGLDENLEEREVLIKQAKAHEDHKILEMLQQVPCRNSSELCMTENFAMEVACDFGTGCPWCEHRHRWFTTTKPHPRVGYEQVSRDQWREVGFWSL